MGAQSNIWFAALDPDSVPTPAPGYVAVFVANGLHGTVNGVLHKKDSSGVVSAVLPDYAYTNEMAQDAIGALVSNSASVWLTYDDANNLLTATIPDGGVSTAKLADGAVSTIKIIDGAVTGSKLAAAAVGSTNIATGAVTAGAIAAGAVGTTAIANLAVGSGQIAGGAVGNAQLGASAVQAGNIAAGAVGSTQLANGAVGSAHLAAGAVGATALATGAVGATQLATDAVTQVKMADNAVGTAELLDANVTNAKLASMAAATFKMRASGAGTGVPIDGTAAQAKAALAITASDVSGLGTAATQNSTAFDAAGAAASAQAASQPLDSDLTAIAALSTTGYGRALLTLADATANTALLNVATQALKGLMSTADKTKLDGLGLGISQTVNVTANGISTGNSAVANLAAWNTLMSNIADNSVVAFPPSVNPYQFSDTCVIPAGKHLRVTGASNQKSIIQTTHATSDIFQVNDWYNEFNGLKFTSSVTRTAGACINSGNNVAVNVTNCDFSGMWDGILYSGGVNAGNLAFVDNCGFTDTKNRGIVVDGANANTLIGHVVMDGTAGVQQVGLDLLQCGSLLVSDSDFIRSVNNLRFNPASPNGVFSVYFINVFFDTATGSSVKFTNTGNIQRVKFTNCWFSGSVHGCEFASTASTLPTAIDFINCDIFANSGRGIYAHGVQDFAAANCRIAGNTTAGVEVLASAGAVTRFTLANNSIGPTAGFGGNGTGVLINAGNYGSYTLKNNDVHGNTTANISDAGSVATTDLKIINDNVGHLITGSIGNLAGTAATSGTGNTALLVARVPANCVTAGQVFRVRLIGVSSSNGTVTFRVHAGSNGTTADSQAWQSVTSAALAANQRAGIDGLLTIRSAGTSGTVQCEATGYYQSGQLPTVVAPVTTPTVNTVGAWFITIACACSSGTFTAHQAVIEAL